MNEIDQIKDIAAASIAQPTMESFLRSVFRYYSKTFNTPLHLVETLPLEHVLLNVYEDQFSQYDEDDKEYLLNKTIDPNFDANEEDEVQDFIKSVLEKNNPLKLKENLTNSTEEAKQHNVTTQSLREMAQGSRRYEEESLDVSPDGLDSLEQALDVDDRTT